MSADFVVTEKGLRIHITDGDGLTRCGWRVVGLADADDVLWYGCCQKCQQVGESRKQPFVAAAGGTP